MHRRHLLRSAVFAGMLLPARSTRVPGASAQAATPCPGDTPEANLEAARRFLLGPLRDRNPAVLDQVAAPDIVLHDPATGTAGGLAAVTGWFQSVLDGFTDLTLEIAPTVAEGDLVACIYRVSGQNTGPYRGVPPTGGQISWSGAAFSRVRCGRVAEVWNVTDRIELMTELGQLPKETLSAVTGSATPAGDAGTPVACPPSGPETSREVSRHYVDDIWSGGDPSQVDVLVAPVVVEHRAWAGKIVGREAFRKSIGERRTGMPDLVYDIQDLIAQGDFGAVRWTASGTDTGGMFEQPPTGTAAKWNGISIYRIACGQVAEAWTESDGYGLMGQLGMLPGTDAATPNP